MPENRGSAGDVAGGALGGAATGAAVGSAIGPWGTVIGGAAGGLIGGVSSYFGGGGRDPGLTDEQRAQYEEYLQMVQGRTAPTSELRKNQLSLISDLEAQSQGRGPSLATMQFDDALDKNQRNQQSYANSARGSAVPLAAFQAQNNMAGLGQQTARDAAMARVAEQIAARNQLGLTLHGARGMDEETALRTMSLNDQAMGQGMATFQGTQPMASTGEQFMAGGAGAIGLMGQMRGAGIVGGGAKPAASQPVGDNTLNPFTEGGYGNSTMNPFGNAAAPTTAKSMRPDGSALESTVTSSTGLRKAGPSTMAIGNTEADFQARERHRLAVAQAQAQRRAAIAMHQARRPTDYIPPPVVTLPQNRRTV